MNKIVWPFLFLLPLILLPSNQTNYFVQNSSSIEVDDALPSVVSPCTNASSFTTIPDMELLITGPGVSVVIFTGNFYAEQGAVYVILSVDGRLLNPTQRLFSKVASDQQFNLAFTSVVPLSPGDHILNVLWRIEAPPPNNHVCATQLGRELIAVVQR